jgi:hypothetical protein
MPVTDIPQVLIFQETIAVYTFLGLHLACTDVAFGDDMSESEKTVAAVYVSWKTFANSIGQLSKAEIPNVIDKTVFTGMAFSVQNQLFAGMRFLGLIDEKSKPTADLEHLATELEDARKDKLKEIIQKRYSELFALNLKKTTPDELTKKMAESYGVTGDTREKAVRFFVSAAEYAGIELSPLLASKKANGGTRTTNRKRGLRKSVSPSPPSSDSVADQPGTSRTVRLQSGGTLTLSATLDLFKLNSGDRKFVFDLIDQLEGYEQPTQPTRESAT